MTARTGEGTSPADRTSEKVHYSLVFSKVFDTVLLIHISQVNFAFPLMHILLGAVSNSMRQEKSIALGNGARVAENCDFITLEFHCHLS